MHVTSYYQKSHSFFEKSVDEKMQSMTLPNDIIDEQFERIFGYIEQNMAANRKKSDKENTMNFNKSSLKRQLEDSQQKMNNKSMKSQHLDCQTTEDDDKSKLMICNICTKTFSKSGHLWQIIFSCRSIEETQTS